MSLNDGIETNQNKKKNPILRFWWLWLMIILLAIGMLVPNLIIRHAMSTNSITQTGKNKVVKVGDTITSFEKPAAAPIEGFEEVKPMVFAGIYPIDSEDFEELRFSLEKLRLNDASLVFEPESSAALGFGFRRSVKVSMCNFPALWPATFARALSRWPN